MANFNSTASLGSLSNMGAGGGLDGNDLRKILIQKVDKIEFDKAIDLKSNRVDTEQSMKALDIIHK